MVSKMKETTTEKSDENKYIGPQRLLKLINDKCVEKIGHKVIRAIYTSINHKTVVEMMNDEVLNFSCYRSAFDHFNIAYNLNLVKKKKTKTQFITEHFEDKRSKIESVNKRLQDLIESFMGSKNIELNNITLYDYFNSNEWKKNEFNKTEIREVITNLEAMENKMSRKYVEYIKRIIFL